MNMLTSQKPSAGVAVEAPCGADETKPWVLDDHWPTLLWALADQVMEGATALQSLIDLLLGKGSISPHEHRALSAPADRIKLASIGPQQIHRF